MLRSKIKLLSIIFVLVIISCSNFVFANESYSDITGHWAESEIEKWSNTGIIKGYEGEFRPDDSITRGEMAVIIDRVLKFVDKSENEFTDLSEDFYTDAILKANYAGIILGDGENVRPIDNITRQEAVVMLARALSIENSKNENEFTDKAEMDEWSIEYINAMTEKNYISGYGDTFKPLADITRAEVIKILDTTITKIYNEEGTYTEDIEGLVIINVPNVKLKAMTIKGNVIIAEGVGDEEVYLEDVKIEGNLYTRGGGENSVYIQGNSSILNIYVLKDSANGIRISIDNNSTVQNINIDKGEKIILTGNLTNVNVNSESNIEFVGAKIDVLNVKSDDATININQESQLNNLIVNNKIDIDIQGSVENIVVNKDATESNINVSDTGKVQSITTDAKISINNNGKIENATVNANDVVINGEKPKSVEIDKTVEVKPVDDKGTEVPTTTPTTPSGGGSGGGGSSTPSIITINVSEDLNTKTEALFTEFYNKPAAATLSPTDAQYYIQVASALTTTPTSIKIGEEVFDINENVSVSMGNNNHINLPAWKIDVNKNLLVAIPVLALESTPVGNVDIDLNNDGSIEIKVTTSASLTDSLTVVSATSLGIIPDGYTNTVNIAEDTVTQTINHGHGYLGILLNDGSDITDVRKVFTKKTYRDSQGNVTSVSYGVTQTEGTDNATIGFYSAGYKNGAFSVDEAKVINIDYKIAVIGTGAIVIPIEVNRTSKEYEKDIHIELGTKTEALFTEFYNKPVAATLSPTDAQYYIQVASALTTTPTSIKIGEEVFDINENVSVSMGNNNHINLPAWKIDVNKNLLVAIPVLALESTPVGNVDIDLNNDGSIEIKVTTSASLTDSLTVVSATSLGIIPDGYTNTVNIAEDTVTQTINHGHGYLGILLNDGSDITDVRKVFTKKTYRDSQGNVTSVSYGVTQTEGTDNATIGFYAAGYKDGAFVESEAKVINIDYKVAIVGTGAIEVELIINKTVKLED